LTTTGPADSSANGLPRSKQQPRRSALGQRPPRRVHGTADLSTELRGASSLDSQGAGSRPSRPRRASRPITAVYFLPM